MRMSACMFCIWSTVAICMIANMVAFSQCWVFVWAWACLRLSNVGHSFERGHGRVYPMMSICLSVGMFAFIQCWAFVWAWARFHNIGFGNEHKRGRGCIWSALTICLSADIVVQGQVWLRAWAWHDCEQIARFERVLDWKSSWLMLVLLCPGATKRILSGTRHL